MLEIIHAGAGSGKTYALCEIAVQRIIAGMHPERLLATTFTRRAAAELKRRIAASLLACEELSPEQRLERVSQLDGALIGTIHSVGYTLVTRHACALGLSPRLRVIDDSMAGQSLQRVLGSLPSGSWERLAETARQMGIDDPEQLVLRLLAAKRDNRISDDAFRRQMQDSAQRVCEICADGRAVVDGGAFDRLGDLVRETLAALAERTDDETKVTEQARVELQRLAHHPSRQWKSFLDAAS